jgi:hypothetical protein
MLVFCNYYSLPLFALVGSMKVLPLDEFAGNVIRVILDRKCLKIIIEAVLKSATN